MVSACLYTSMPLSDSLFFLCFQFSSAIFSSFLNLSSIFFTSPLTDRSLNKSLQFIPTALFSHSPVSMFFHDFTNCTPNCWTSFPLNFFISLQKHREIPFEIFIFPKGCFLVFSVFCSIFLLQ